MLSVLSERSWSALGSTLRLRYESQLLGGSQAFQQAARQQAPHSLVVCRPRSRRRSLGAHFDFDTSPSYWVGAKRFFRQLACQQAPRCLVGLQAAQSLVCMLAARSTVRVPPWPMQRAYRPTDPVQHRPPATMTAPCSQR